MNQSVLLVDIADGSGLDSLLRGSGYLVDAATDGAQAVRRAEACRPHLAIIDIALPGPPDGVETAKTIRDLGIPVIYLGAAEESLLRRAAAVAPAGYLAPPVHDGQLDLAIRGALASARPVGSPPSELDRGRTRLTEAKRTEAALKDANRRLQEHEQTLNSVLESIGDGVLVLDTDAKVILASHSAHRMVGEGMLARTDPSRWRKGHGVFLPDGETPIPLEDMPHVRAVANESTTDFRVLIRNPKVPNGIHLSLDCQPMRDPSGRIRGAVLVARDETPGLRAQQALSNAFAHGRLEVLDTIVHNIGNAINSVDVGLGTVQNVVRDNVLVRRLSALADVIAPHADDWETFLIKDRKGRQVVPFLLALAKDFERQNEQLVRTVARVAGRVAHIVEIVRTQTKRYGGAIERVDVDFQQALVDAANILRESITKRGIQLSIHSRGAPREIHVQQSRFHQLIVNLIKNAIDAIDEGRRLRPEEKRGAIRVSAQVVGHDLVIEVSDDGIGIDPKDLDLIFRSDYTTKSNGSGLGLHSAANYVGATGGAIEPSSAGIGKGATIRVAWKLEGLLSAATLASRRAATRRRGRAR